MSTIKVTKGNIKKFDNYVLYRIWSEATTKSERSLAMTEIKRRQRQGNMVKTSDNGPSIIYWGAKKSKSAPGKYKSVVKDNKGHYYLNHHFAGQDKEYHEDVAGMTVSRMRGTTGFEYTKYKKI